MKLRVNLVVMLMAVICIKKTLQAQPRFLARHDDSEADGPESSPLGFMTSREANSIESNQDRTQIVRSKNRGFFDDASDALEDAKHTIRNVHTYVRQAVQPRRQMSNRRMMALLMAYKMKMAILIPTLIGGMILLSSTTALAGFFFALFAAVLGLKAK